MSRDNRVAVGEVWRTVTHGSFFLATLGFGTESRWDSRMARKHIGRNLSKSCGGLEQNRLHSAVWTCDGLPQTMCRELDDDVAIVARAFDVIVLGFRFSALRNG